MKKVYNKKKISCITGAILCILAVLIVFVFPLPEVPCDKCIDIYDERPLGMDIVEFNNTTYTTIIDESYLKRLGLATEIADENIGDFLGVTDTLNGNAAALNVYKLSQYKGRSKIIVQQNGTYSCFQLHYHENDGQKSAKEICDIYALNSSDMIKCIEFSDGKTVDKTIADDEIIDGFFKRMYKLKPDRDTLYARFRSYRGTYSRYEIDVVLNDGQRLYMPVFYKRNASIGNTEFYLNRDFAKYIEKIFLN